MDPILSAVTVRCGGHSTHMTIKFDARILVYPGCSGSGLKLSNVPACLQSAGVNGVCHLHHHLLPAKIFFFFFLEFYSI